MSDSLRDQLLKAGFNQSEPKAKPDNRKRRKSGGRHQTTKAASKATNTGQTTSAQSNEPKAGYTYVPPTPAKKKKAKKPPAIKARAGSWSTKSSSQDTRTGHEKDPVAAQKHREMKLAIQTLIETNAIKDFKGEEVYRFTLRNKIREILVSDPIRQQLADGQLAITRLNGATRLIPSQTAQSIRDINPQWTIFLTSDVDDAGKDDDEEFPIPDDLMW